MSNLAAVIDQDETRTEVTNTKHIHTVKKIPTVVGSGSGVGSGSRAGRESVAPTRILLTENGTVGGGSGVGRESIAPTKVTSRSGSGQGQAQGGGSGGGSKAKSQASRPLPKPASSIQSRPPPPAVQQQSHHHHKHTTISIPVGSAFPLSLPVPAPVAEPKVATPPPPPATIIINPPPPPPAENTGVAAVINIDEMSETGAPAPPPEAVIENNGGGGGGKKKKNKNKNKNKPPVATVEDGVEPGEEAGATTTGEVEPPPQTQTDNILGLLGANNMNFEIPRLAPHDPNRTGQQSKRTLHATVSVPVGPQHPPPPPPATIKKPTPPPTQVMQSNVSVRGSPSTRTAPPPPPSQHHTHRFPHSGSHTSSNGGVPQSVGPTVVMRSLDNEQRPATIYQPTHTHTHTHAPEPTEGPNNHAPIRHHQNEEFLGPPPPQAFQDENGVTTILNSQGPVVIYPAQQPQQQQEEQEQGRSGREMNFMDIRPVPIIDYESFMRAKNPPLPSPPPPASVVLEQLETVVEQSHPIQMEVEAEYDNGNEHLHYHAHAIDPNTFAPIAAGGSFHQSRHHTPSRLTVTPPNGTVYQHDHNDYNVLTPVEPSSTPHHRKHRKKKDRDVSGETEGGAKRPPYDRHGSSAKSEVYAKLDEVPIAADRVGRYAYPPDSQARMAREEEARKKEAERVLARAKGGSFPGMLPTGGYLAMGPSMYMRPPPLGAFPPMNPMMMMMRPPMMNPMMGPMGMGMGMGMGMNPMMGPMGMMGGMRNFNAIPGRFGRDILGRDFAGPGGIGHSQPYRPPDPSVPHPLPQGLPIVARPPREGFDAYGRPLPPPLPEGVDGWGRILPTMNNPDGTRHPWAPFGFGPPPAPPPVPEAAPPVAAGGGLPSDSPEDSSARPEEPACFARPPTQGDLFPYSDFQTFSFAAKRLAHPHRLRRPQELADHDIDISEWDQFIRALAAEAFRYANMDSGEGETDDRPRLTLDVHEMLREWQVGFFGPRAISIFPTRNGKRVFDHGFGVHRTKAANTYGQTPTETSRDDISRIDSDDGELPNMEAKYSARERQVRRELRAIEKRKRDLKDTWKDPHQAKEWNLTFTWAEPTLWQPSAKPRRYGEKVPFQRPKF